MLQVQNVSKSYASGSKNREQILSDVELSIAENETVAFLGKSGSGKSTLAEIICGLTPPDSGNVFWQNEPLYGKNMRYDRKRASHIKMITQQPISAFDPKQSFRSALIEVSTASDRTCSKQEALKRIYRIFETVGLERDLLSRKPSAVSGGQAQRAAIARALVTDPKLLICDEATAMLDLTAQAKVINLIKKIKEERGLSVLLITHDKALAEALGDRSYIIENKHIREI